MPTVATRCVILRDMVELEIYTGATRAVRRGCPSVKLVAGMTVAELRQVLVRGGSNHGR
jgi:hypothetical protein